ncbi:MAG TPA: winged helix-turn-helix domain-containing protein [Candidatus Thermoplasmatota archaeon]|nr:winged helix-turn-helix domain-containing protein [Candidatus Thermoplasmatota archaeon]
MAEHFDIYQSGAGFRAVTNEVRRRILDLLVERERQLPELVELTGKAKPTLSSVHMRALIEDGLVEEVPHPHDARKKIYRIAARKIGSWNGPDAEPPRRLRELSRGTSGLRVGRALAAMTVPEAEGATTLVHAQARALGEETADTLASGTLRDVLAAVASFWEREHLAIVPKIDLDGPLIEIALDEGFARERDEPLVAKALAGFLEGVLSAKGVYEGHAEPTAAAGDRRYELRLAPASAPDRSS